jgi:probable F420-dependent oxidoreductase
MKFGLMAPYQLAPVEDGHFAADLGRCAEDMGFESIWAVDHVVMCPNYESKYPYDPSGRSPFDENVIQPDPLIWLTWVASATTTLKLGTGILILPLRNPTVLAKETASLDRLSGGRLLLGIGVGWVEEESKAVGMEFGNRGRRCDEYVESMRSLWNEPVSTYQGRHVAFDDVVSLPKPASTGGVPILVGGHSPAAARRAGRLGDGFFPLGVFGAELDDLLAIMADSAREVGRDPSDIEVTVVGAPDRGFVENCRDQGISRFLISPASGEISEIRKSLEGFQKEVMEPLSD